MVHLENIPYPMVTTLPHIPLELNIPGISISNITPLYTLVSRLHLSNCTFHTPSIGEVLNFSETPRTVSIRGIVAGKINGPKVPVLFFLLLFTVVLVYFARS